MSASRCRGVTQKDQLTSEPLVPGPAGCIGSWLCENARTLDGDRRSYSFTTVLAVEPAGASNLENELKNVILAGLRSFAFLPSQGQKR